MPRQPKTNQIQVNQRNISLNSLTHDIVAHNICKKVDFTFTKLSFETVNMLHYEYKLKDLKISDKITFSLSFKNSWKGLMHFLLCLGYSEHKDKFHGRLYNNKGYIILKNFYSTPLLLPVDNLGLCNESNCDENTFAQIYINQYVGNWGFNQYCQQFEVEILSPMDYHKVEKLLTRKSQPPLLIEDFHYNSKNIINIILAALKLLELDLKSSKIQLDSCDYEYEYTSNFTAIQEYNRQALYHLLKYCHDDYTIVSAQIMKALYDRYKAMIVHPCNHPLKALEADPNINHSFSNHFIAYPLFCNFHDPLVKYFPCLADLIKYFAKQSCKHPVGEHIADYIDITKGDMLLEHDCYYLLIAVRGLNYLLNPFGKHFYTTTLEN